MDVVVKLDSIEHIEYIPREKLKCTSYLPPIEPGTPRQLHMFYVNPSSWNEKDFVT
jgi:hypothetical protein